MRSEKETSLTNGYEKQTLYKRGHASSRRPPPRPTPQVLSSRSASGQVVLKTVRLQVRLVAFATLQFGRHGVLDVK